MMTVAEMSRPPNRRIPVESVITRYGLEGAIAQSVTPEVGDALTAIHAALVDMSTKIAAAKSAEKKNESGEVKSDVLAEQYGKDEQGRDNARSFLRDSDMVTENGENVPSILDLLVEYCNDDPCRTFHLLNAFTDLVMPYLKNEVSFFRGQVTPKVASESEVKSLRADYNELRGLLVNVAGIATTMRPDFTHPSFVMEGGKPKSTLAGIRGAGKSGTVHGKYARIYRLTFTIDGDDFSPGTPLSEIVRNLWHGTDRIGKSAKDLAALLDENVPSWSDPAMATVSFSVNGHDVTVSRGNDTENDDDDEEEGDDEE